MSAAADLRARAGRIQDRDHPAPEPAPAVPPTAPRTGKVRQTVDLPAAQHEALAAWRLETALGLGRTRLTTQDVLAAAVAALLDPEDQTVARRVRARLEGEQ